MRDIKDINGVKVKHGDSVICVIGDTPIYDAKASIANDRVYVCQNKKDGHKIDNTFEYKYSWSLDHHVMNLEVVEKDYEIF